MTPKEVLAFAQKNKTKMVDLKFLDFPGIWQHFSVPLHELDESSFEGASVLTVRASGAGSLFTPATCW